MSLTRSRGVFGASHWITVSAVVVEYLDYLLGTYLDTKEVAIPTSAISALQELFSSALLVAKDEPMQNPQASINDYLVMKKVMRRGGVPTRERKDVRREIEEHFSLLHRLTELHTMEDLDRESVVKTRIFLRYLQDQGESERYDRFMRQSHLYNHRDDPPDDE